MPEPILELKNLQTYFPVRRGLVFRRSAGIVKAVDGVSRAVRSGEVLGLVGESGCGKSTLARTILQLVPATAGSVVLEGRNLTAAGAAELRASRRTMQAPTIGTQFSSSMCVATVGICIPRANVGGNGAASIMPDARLDST